MTKMIIIRLLDYSLNSLLLSYSRSSFCHLPLLFSSSWNCQILSLSLPIYSMSLLLLYPSLSPYPYPLTPVSPLFRPPYLPFLPKFDFFLIFWLQRWPDDASEASLCHFRDIVRRFQDLLRPLQLLSLLFRGWETLACKMFVLDPQASHGSLSQCLQDHAILLRAPASLRKPTSSSTPA